MGEHHFAKRPQAAGRPGMVDLVLPDLHPRLATDRGMFSLDRGMFCPDRGMFSPGRIGSGTRVLLGTVPPPPATGDLLGLGCGYGPVALTMAARSPQVSAPRSEPSAAFPMTTTAGDPPSAPRRAVGGGSALTPLSQGGVRPPTGGAARRLLASREPARRAYVAADGTPRALPMPCPVRVALRPTRAVGFRTRLPGGSYAEETR